MDCDEATRIASAKIAFAIFAKLSCAQNTEEHGLGNRLSAIPYSQFY